jgi:hypothetical protein
MARSYKIKIILVAISLALSSFNQIALKVPGTRRPPTAFLAATSWSIDFDLIEVFDSECLLQMPLIAASLRHLTHEVKLLSRD